MNYLAHACIFGQFQAQESPGGGGYFTLGKTGMCASFG